MGKKKRRRKANPFPMIIRMLLIIIGGILLCGLIIKYIKESNKSIRGTWVRTIDYTDEVSMNMSKWICSAIDGNQVEIEDYLGDAEVKVAIVFDKDTYTISADKQSYKECEADIIESATNALAKLIGNRLTDIGITSEVDVNSLFETAYGISLRDYVKDYAPSFLPTYALISSEIDESGDYTISDGLLYMGHGTKEELTQGTGLQYMVGDMLVFMDNDQAYVYYKPEKNEKTEPVMEEIIDSEARAKNVDNNIIKDLSTLWKLDVNAASAAYPFAMQAVNDNSGEEFAMGAYYVDYAGNMFLSLRDLAMLLAGTDKAYDFAITKEDIVIRTGKDYIPSGGENMEFPEETKELGYKINSNLSSKKILYNDEPRKYYLMSAENAEGNKDYYMSMLDISLLMDITMERDGDKLIVYPDRHYVINPEKMQEDSEYFEMSRSALVGDVTTGDVYYSYHEDEQVPMASTTKLMTYIVIMDAVYNGDISESDILSASDKVIALSMTSDRVIPMEEGQTASFKDALMGMLLGSSNECSLMLAEHVAGSEEAFVDRMNAKAEEIGLSEATHFYNCNGLPIYSEDTTNTKMQNHITAMDMFTLCKYLMSLYPEIADITSVDEVELESFKNQEIKNTNPIIFNIPNMIGFKTGTTSNSGACLIAAAKTDDSEDAHVIVSAMFGAESAILRSQISEVLMRYGLQYYEGAGHSPEVAGTSSIPDNLEAIIRNLINVARKQLTQ